MIKNLKVRSLLTFFRENLKVRIKTINPAPLIYVKYKTRPESSERCRIKIKRGNLVWLFMFLIYLMFNSNIPVLGKNSYLLSPLAKEKAINKGNEVFGFAPYWTFDKLDNVDFSVLTTFAYFGVPVDGDGNLSKDDYGYSVFKSDKATDIFRKAHQNGTRVVLTLTQMENDPIQTFLSNSDSQQNAIDQIVAEIKDRGIDGANIDFEYNGDPGQEYRDMFSIFIHNLAKKMHEEIPDSKLTVSVYAASAKNPMLYDIKKLGKDADGVFMMAYDFANASSDDAMPTAPLHGHEKGKYWYDVASAVSDFLNFMPSNKLILGVPYYGYNYPVYTPKVKAKTYYYLNGNPQTYSDAQDKLGDNGNVKTGWDKDGQVGWKAYFDSNSYIWRMIFLEDVKSLSLKYDFAKNNNLKGVGIWALGFDSDKKELWTLLKDKFGTKFADSRVVQKEIGGSI